MALKDIVINISAGGVDQTVGGIGRVNQSVSGMGENAERNGRRVQTATGQMEAAWQKMAAGIQGSLGGLVSGLSLGYLVKEALSAALAVEKITASMTATAGSGQAAARELAFIREEANRLGLAYNDTALAYTKFMASTRNTPIEGEATRRIFIGVSEAVTAMKLSGEESNGIFLALSQMMSKGKISAEELTGQLGERLPGAVKLTADAMGLTTAELLKQMQAGKLMSADVLPKLAEQLHQTYGAAAVEAARGGTAEINRLNNAVAETKAALGTALMPTFVSLMNNVIKPLADYITMFIGGLEILAVKLAALPDKASAGWQFLKGGGSFSAAATLAYKNQIAEITANQDSVIADIMQKYTPASSSKSATDLAAEQARAAEAKAKEIAGRAASAHKKALTDQQKEYQSQIKEFLKSAWEGAANQLAAEDFTSDTSKMLGMMSSKKTGFTKNPAFSLGVGQLQSLEQQEDATKKLKEAEAERAAGLREMLAIQRELAEMDYVNKQLETSMIDKPYEREKQEIDDLYSYKKSMLEIELKNTEKTATEKAKIEKHLALLKQKHDKDTLDNSNKSFKSQLSMAAEYTGMAGQMFSALANTQDQTSRQGFETAKAFNIASAVMSTASAIMNAWANVPYPMNIAAATLAAATGAIQIANIESTTFGGGATAPSAPSGSFSAAGGSSAGSTGIGNLQAPLLSVQDSQTYESMVALTKSTDNAAVAIGRLAKGIDSLTDLFSDGGAGMGLATNAPGMYQGTTLYGTLAHGTITNMTDMVTKGVRAWGSQLQSLFKFNFEDFGKNFGNAIYQSIGGDMIWGGDWQSTGAGITLSVKEGVIQAQDYIQSERDPGLFQDTEHKIEYISNPAATKFMSNLIGPYITEIGRMALTLGTTVDTKSYTATPFNLATAGRKPEEIAEDLAKWTKETLQGMALTVKGLEDNVGAYDDAYTMLIKYNDALVSTNDSLELIGAKTLQGSFANAKMADALQTMMGGMDNFTESVDNYFASMFTDAQQQAMKATQAARQVNDAFTDMGFALPKTNAEFIRLVNVQDLATESGAALFKALMDIAPAFAEVQRAAEDAANALRDSSNDLYSRGVQSGAIAIAGYETNKDLFDLRIQQEEEIRSYIEKGLDTTLLAVIQYREYASLTAEIAATEKKRVTDLEARYLRAIGNSGEADLLSLRMQQENEILEYQKNNISTTRLATIQQLEYAAAVKRVEEATKSAVNELNTTLVSTALSAANALKSIIGGDLSTKSPETLYAESQAAWASAMANNRAAELPALGQALLTASRGYNASGAGYVSDYNVVTAKLMELAGMTGTPTLDAAERQIQILADIQKNTALTSGSTATLAQLMYAQAATYAMRQATGLDIQNSAYDINNSGWVDIVDALNYQRLAKGLPAFARGGVTSGLSLAGEDGPEAIIPLPDGRRVPVMISGSADNKETVAELKAINSKLEATIARLDRIEGHEAASVRIQQYGFKRRIEQGDEANKNGSTIAQKTRLAGNQ